jgi:hypothetical protein
VFSITRAIIGYPAKLTKRRLRYNPSVAANKLGRRPFLRLLPAAAASLLAPPTPLAPTPDTAEAPQCFVPRDDYHELPPECYAQNLIRPFEIIVHWDGNRQGREMWLAPVTFETLRYLGQSAHFAVDLRRIWQMLPMYQTVVQESHGAMGYNWAAINVEMAGTEFDLPGNAPPENQVRLTLRLVSQLMDFYGIAYPHVVGHFERDPRGDKRDPGVLFMETFRRRLWDYRAALSPAKRQGLADP